MLRALAVTLALLAAPVSAQLYTPDEMRHTFQAATPDIQRVFTQDILGNLPRDLRPRAAQVRLEFPEQGRSPLDFFAHPGRGVIYFPIESIRFFDDVATLFAWVESQNCNPEAIQAYLWAKLREGRPLPSPLRAFNIDRDTAFADEFTYNVSGKIVSSGLQFILAHELGHILLNHEGELPSAESQRQEIAADAFALDHFERLGGLPMGVFWYYMAAWWLDPRDEAGRDASSHPVSPARIATLAARLTGDPMAYSHGELDPNREAELAAQIGAMVAELATLIDDDGMLNLMPLVLDRDWPATRIAQACPTP